jgi:hypothetical protein
VDSVRIAVCRDRACTRVEQEFDAVDSTARVPSPLAPGVWFWNVREIVSGVPDAMTSATWTFRTPTADGPNEWSIADRNDFDGDGVDDLLVSCYQPMPGRAVVYRGNAAGELNPVVVWNDLAHAIGDVDGDGFTDLQARGGLGSDILLGGADMSRVEVLQRVDGSDAAGAFTGGSEFDIALGDFDGDGYADAMLEESTWGGSFSPRLAYGSPHGWPLPLVDLGAGANSIAWDLDADGIDDVLAAGPIWWRGSGTRPLAPSSVAMKTSMYVVPVGDLDRDGFLDAVEFDESQIAFIRGGSAGPTLGALRSLDAGGRRLFVGRYGDLDGDGRDDLVFRGAATASGTEYIAYLGGADGYSPDRIATVTSLPCSPRLLWGLRTIGDYDDDGVIDTFLSCDDDRLFVQLSRIGSVWAPVPLPDGVTGCLAN